MKIIPGILITAGLLPFYASIASADESIDDLVRKLQGRAEAPAPGRSKATSSPRTSNPPSERKLFQLRGSDRFSPRRNRSEEAPQPAPQEAVAEVAPEEKRSWIFRWGLPGNIQLANRRGAVEVRELTGEEGSGQGQSFEVSYDVDPSSQVTRHSIPFEVNSTELANAQAVLELTKLAQAFRRPELKGQMFVIEGHSSADGTEAHNLKLSNERAVVLVKHLTRLGVPEGKLVPVGVGEADARHPATASENLRSQDRRVEIYRMEQ